MSEECRNITRDIVFGNNGKRIKKQINFSIKELKFENGISRFRFKHQFVDDHIFIYTDFKDYYISVNDNSVEVYREDYARLGYLINYYDRLVDLFFSSLNLDDEGMYYPGTYLPDGYLLLLESLKDKLYSHSGRLLVKIPQPTLVITRFEQGDFIDIEIPGENYFYSDDVEDRIDYQCLHHKLQSHYVLDNSNINLHNSFKTSLAEFVKGAEAYDSEIFDYVTPFTSQNLENIAGTFDSDLYATTKALTVIKELVIPLYLQVSFKVDFCFAPDLVIHTAANNIELLARCKEASGSSETDMELMKECYLHISRFFENVRQDYETCIPDIQVGGPDSFVWTDQADKAYEEYLRAKIHERFNNYDSSVKT